MRAIPVCATLLVVAFAGCSDEARPSATTDEDFDGVDVQVTEDTGAIRGVVLNDAIVPVEGASVQVLNTEYGMDTDAEGRFAFSKVPPGTYFLAVSKPLHQSVQATVQVEAGVKEPAILKVQLVRDFQEDPYLQTIPMDGFFTCSQAGGIVWGYSSSPCHSVTYPVVGPHDLCDEAGLCLEQNRVFHANVGPGWQTQIFEMTWEQSAYGTSEKMGMSVSTYHPTRNKNHWFASVDSTDPMYFRINTGEMHDTAQEGSGPDGPLPAEGMVDMSMYMSVRKPDTPGNVVPGLSIDQDFQAWVTQFYYAPAPEGWSFINGSPDPF